MPETEQELAALLEYASADDRICPLPIKWHEFWQLIGAPRELHPFVLSGWSFSTDRQKRARFRDQIKHATAAGNMDMVRTFVERLETQEWHCNRGGDMDWCYGDTILEDIKDEERALKSAREHYERLTALAGDDAAFSRDIFADTLFSYYLLFEMRGKLEFAEALRSSLKLFDHLTIENEVSLLEGDHPSVVSALLAIRKAKEIELLMLEIIDCIWLARGTMDRDDVDSFVEEMFDDQPT
jgi:hypothetical protein